MNMTTKKYKEIGIDAPIENPADDCLDRDVFAKRVFKIIEGTPISSNVIIGIYGSWGSGKTTTMNFIKWYCEKAGHPVAVYCPWQFHNREEAWKGFVSSIDKGLAKWEGRIIGSFQRQNLVKKASKKVREITAVTEVGRIVGSLVLAPLEGLLEPTKQKVQDELNKALKDKRLFIFVDDLDRADPNIVYDILMFLNEIVDLNRCIYVIGLDTRVAYLAIEKKIGKIDCKEFLDKIIHWQYELPEPTDFEWQELLDKEIELLGKSGEALKSIFPQLPRNPRKLKHFLRYIAGLHKSFLSRFSDDELDWKILYLTQLIKIEFPEAFKRILTDEHLLEYLSSGLLKIALSKDDEASSREWEERLNELVDELEIGKKERLQELCSSIRGHGWIGSVEELKKHMLIIETPELLTWKEYNEFKKKLLKSSQKELQQKELASFIKKARKNKEIERAREFIRMLIRDREQLHSLAIEEVDLETGIKPFLAQIKEVMDICFSLLKVNDAFEGYNPIFNEDVFREWYTYLIKWAHFKRSDGKPYVYDEIRKLEADLAYECAIKLKHKASIILEILSAQKNHSTHPETFKELHDKISKELEEALAEQLVERFRRIDGIKELWEYHDRCEKRLLFNGDSTFHNESIYTKLKSIADEASSNPIIHKNFCEFTRMLFYGATEESSNLADIDEVKNLLKGKKEFINIVWKATVSRQMNRRTVGSLEERRSKIIKEGILDAEQLKPPIWYEELISDVKDKIS